MVNIYNLAALILNDLNNLPNVKSLKLGLEKGIGAKDTPLIRVVPIQASIAEHDRVNVTFDVFIVTDTKNDFDTQYQKHFMLEQLIKERLHLQEYSGGICHYISTLTDADTIQNLKATSLTFEIRGLVNYD